jgi:serine O-acetyltransferase
MNCTLSQDQLASYVARQVRYFYPDGVKFRTLLEEVTAALPAALDRLAIIAQACLPPLFNYAGVKGFNHLYSDQYAMFLYLLSNESGCVRGTTSLATKLYLLNKALHGVEAYYEIKLPPLFLFMHPIGTVLGRADYGDRFVVLQNCTVGNVRSVYPKIGSGVVMCAGSSVLGDAEIGDGATIGAGALVVGRKVPANSVVIGRGREMSYTTPDRPAFWQEFFVS